MSNPFPTQTPNVVIENPKARKIARAVLDVLGVALAILTAVDGASDAFSVTEFTVPVIAGWAAARAGFGLTVDYLNTPSDNPNTPTV